MRIAAIIAWIMLAVLLGLATVTAEEIPVTSSNLNIRDPADVVAKVLNYSNWGNDDGSGDDNNFWVKAAKGKCKYKRKKNDEPDLGQGAIDLNALDPKYITFEHVTIEGLALGRFMTNERVVIATITRHLKKIIITGAGELDFERLKRGWASIYSKYCTGKKNPF